MRYRYNDHSDADQLRARQVGESAAARPQPPQACANAAGIGVEIDQQIERVRWLMRREPMLEGRELKIEN
jgi:hypothetical protein